MTYELDRSPQSPEPTLEQMTRAAIERLSASPDGYYLMVEGGRIDHGHHDGRAGYALEEGRAFAEAVQAAIDMTDGEDTLILVTADHSHVFTIAGYPTRGNPILGLVYGNDWRGEPSDEPLLADDGLPFTTLGYHNGPGAVEGPRVAPEPAPKMLQQALIPTPDGEGGRSETHGGEDVALYPQGPGAAGVRGVMEQNLIFNVIVEAFGWAVGSAGQSR